MRSLQLGKASVLVEVGFVTPHPVRPIGAVQGRQTSGYRNAFSKGAGAATCLQG